MAKYLKKYTQQADYDADLQQGLILPNVSVVTENNKTFYNPYVFPPVISGKETFTGTTQVTITCQTAGASIYYTLDGSTPTTGSTAYTGTVTLSATTTVKAIAAKGGVTTSVVSKEFEKEEPPFVIEAVDLGLPSGRKWANANLGANSITDYGEYFSWGNVDGHKPSGTTFDYNFDQATYNSTSGASVPFTSETKNADYSVDSGCDAAREMLGGSWRMPTANEFVELFNSAYTMYIDANGDEVTGSNKLVTVDGVMGVYLKSKVNNCVLFFPCAGYGYGTSLYNSGSDGVCWSSSLYSSTYGYSLNFNSGGVNPLYSSRRRYYGFSVRAVQ